MEGSGSVERDLLVLTGPAVTSSGSGAADPAPLHPFDPVGAKDPDKKYGKKSSKKPLSVGNESQT